MSRLRVDRRAVSVTVGYVLMLAVAMLLMGALLAGASGLMESRSAQVANDQLTVVGDQLAAALGSTDRMAQVAREDAAATGTTPTVGHTVDLPRRVAGSGYRIAVDDEEITLRRSNPDVEVTVDYAATRVPVEPTNVSGGRLRIAYNSTADQLEVTND